MSVHFEMSYNNNRISSISLKKLATTKVKESLFQKFMIERVLLRVAEESRIQNIMNQNPPSPACPVFPDDEERVWEPNSHYTFGKFEENCRTFSRQNSINTTFETFSVASV